MILSQLEGQVLTNQIVPVDSYLKSTRYSTRKIWIVISIIRIRSGYGSELELVHHHHSCVVTTLFHKTLLQIMLRAQLIDH
jgi:hypothetical protein